MQFLNSALDNGLRHSGITISRRCVGIVVALWLQSNQFVACHIICEAMIRGHSSFAKVGPRIRLGEQKQGQARLTPFQLFAEMASGPINSETPNEQVHGPTTFSSPIELCDDIGLQISNARSHKMNRRRSEVRFSELHFRMTDSRSARRPTTKFEWTVLPRYIQWFFQFPDRSSERAAIVEAALTALNNPQGQWMAMRVRLWFNNNRHAYPGPPPVPNLVLHPPAPAAFTQPGRLSHASGPTGNPQPPADRTLQADYASPPLEWRPHHFRPDRERVRQLRVRPQLHERTCGPTEEAPRPGNGAHHGRQTRGAQTGLRKPADAGGSSLRWRGL
jgi:hypothetical protein